MYIRSTLIGHVNYFKVLSSLVVNALRMTGGVEAHKTCNFIEKMDKLFDCFNVSSYTAGRKARKEFQKPYTKPTDFRLNVSLQAYHVLPCITGNLH